MIAVASVRSTPGRALTNGVVLPWSTGRVARILAGVYPSDPSPTVLLVAPDALSLAGLRRVASLAGLRECLDAASSSMSLRHRGCGVGHTGLDVEVGEDGVVVRVERLPAPEAWDRLYAVLTILDRGSGAGGAEASRRIAT
jgi:FAD/FMN-containing dehydrogenase